MINKENIYEIANKLRSLGYVTYKGYAPTIIKMMFLKYISEYENENLTVEDYKVLRVFQNALYSNSIDLDIINNACFVIQKTYQADVRKLNFGKAYESIFWINDYSVVIEACKSIVLPKAPEEIQEIIFNILGETEGESLYNSTNKALMMLAHHILDINENDSFMDCFCGYNKIAMLHEARRYAGFEIDNEIACISAMIMIMSGKKNFEVINSDFYEINHGYYHRELYDKVYSDGPIGMYVSDFAHMIHSEGKKYKSDYFNVKLALDSLSERGRAFITVPGNVLFSVNKNYILLREEILPYLKSVMALPPMWIRTNVPTFVLVLEKDNSTNLVSFIDASNKGILQRNKIYSLDANVMGEIYKAYTGVEIEGFSVLVTKEQIKGVKDYVLTPNFYIKKNDVVNYRPVGVIKAELGLLYDELKRML